jgi:sulfate/thiosulfate transport system permease protein
MKNNIILPGFKRSLAYTIFYLTLIVILPLGGLLLKSLDIGISGFIGIFEDERIRSSFLISFSAAFISSIINVIFGLIIAWTLVRYQFPFKGTLNTLIDLPLTLPTAVAGISLTTIFSKKYYIGEILLRYDIKLIHNYYGILIALIFIGIPYVVRTVQPLIIELQKDDEEAAFLLGASKWQIFYFIQLPYLKKAIFTGFALAFSRTLGEYGSVIFISGNLPYETEILPLMIVSKLEQYQFIEASAIASIMLLSSMFILIIISYLNKDKKI